MQLFAEILISALLVIGGTFGWLTTQFVLTTRMRIPAYDLPAPTSEEPVTTASGRPEQGGEPR